jgi:hypothetical protein
MEMKAHINNSFGFNLIFKRSFPFLLFFIGVYYFCFRILGFNLEYIPGDLGDSRFINFLLEHGHQYLIGNENSFWSAEFMYPFKNSIALSDNMLGTLPFYSIWRMLGFEMESSYQLWWLSMSFLNFWICYWVVFKWGQNSYLAAILAWIFAFSIFNIGQLNYMQMIARFMVPVAFYAAFKMISNPSKKYLSLYLFSILLQTYCVMYTGIYTIYFSLLFIVLYCLLSKQFKSLLFYLKKDQLMITGIST